MDLSHHNRTTSIKIDKCAAIVRKFESGELPEHNAISQLQELAGRPIDPDWLRNYWRSESTDSFIERLLATKLLDWQSITDSQAEALIAEYLDTSNTARRDTIENAINRRYRKPSGTLSDLVFQRDISEPKRILEELKKHTTIAI